MVDHLERRFFDAHDGTRLACYSTGPEAGPPFVISAGLGGGVRAWTRIIERLSSTMRVHAWDYRGLYGSETPTDDKSYGVVSQARDLSAFLEHLQLLSPATPILAGWSMGVQVSLEFQRTHPDVPSAFIAVHGTSGYPLQTAFDQSTPARIGPAVFEAMRKHWRWAAKPASTVARSDLVIDLFMAACRRFGIMDGEMNREIFHAIARDWAELDLGAYAETFEQLGEHDATAVLPNIHAPTLIVAGGRDKFTPAFLSERMAHAIPNAELFLLPDATHFGLLEYADDVADCIESFLRRQHK